MLSGCIFNKSQTVSAKKYCLIKTTDSQVMVIHTMYKWQWLKIHRMQVNKIGKQILIEQNTVQCMAIPGLSICKLISALCQGTIYYMSIIYTWHENNNSFSHLMTEHIVHHTKLSYQSRVANVVHSKVRQVKYAVRRQYTENIVVTAIVSCFVYDTMQVLSGECQRFVLRHWILNLEVLGSNPLNTFL